MHRESVQDVTATTQTTTALRGTQAMLEPWGNIADIAPRIWCMMHASSSSNAAL